MKANINDTPLREYSAIPTYWPDRPRTINYDKLSTEEHFADGWRDIVEPVILTDTQRKGPLVIETDGTVTYEVIDLTSQEIQSRIISQAESERQERIRVEQEKAVTATFNAITDVNELLSNQNIFPIWAADLTVITGEKYQHFDAENNLVLFEVVQGHTTQTGWEPLNVPALFKRVAAENEVLPWVQPLGAQDAYQIGDRVTFGGQTWESTATNNVWQPGVFGWAVV